MSQVSTSLTQLLGIEYPIIGGPMYPCSNPELVAAVSAAGGIGVVQPISLTYVHKHGFREGLRYIRSLTDRPIGLNVLVEKSSNQYLKKNMEWVDIALEEGVRFYITALGNPGWVVKRLEGSGSAVFHDVTALNWAKKALDAGVNGLICVNNRAGGHAGDESPEQLLRSMRDFRVPLVCAGGIGDHANLKYALNLGYSGVQIGTRFIASVECNAHDDYKRAILDAEESDIVLTRKLTGVPISIINTDFMRKRGAEMGKVGNFLLAHPRSKHLLRSLMMLRSLWELKRSMARGASYKEYFQAGKSVASIKHIDTVAQIIRNLAGDQLAGTTPALDVSQPIECEGFH